MRKERDRRRGGGLLVPGLVLTALAVAGVVILLVVGSPILPRRLPGMSVTARGDERRSVPVAPTPSRRPSGTPAPGSPGGRPTGGLTVPPTTAMPGEPRTSASASASARPPATRPPATRPPTTPPRTTPPPPRCKAGSATLAAVADTYVDQASPTRSFGSQGNLLVTSRDRSRNRRSLVRFAIPSVPSGCTLRSATFTLSAKDVTGQRLLVARAGKAWSESTTWATAPAPSGASVAATVSGSTVSWTVTSLVASGAGNGFVVRAATENAKGAGEQTNFGSRFGAGAPVLVLRWS